MDRISVSTLVIVVCPDTMFSISWVKMYAANDATENLICSWNHHRILGPQGCLPVENAQLPAAKLIPAVSEAVKVCEERGGRLARIS